MDDPTPLPLEPAKEGWPVPPYEWQELSEIKEVGCGALSVVVDFNELLADKGEPETFRLIGALKDLLP